MLPDTCVEDKEVTSTLVVTKIVVNAGEVTPGTKATVEIRELSPRLT